MHDIIIVIFSWHWLSLLDAKLTLGFISTNTESEARIYSILLRSVVFPLSEYNAYAEYCFFWFALLYEFWFIVFTFTTVLIVFTFFHTFQSTSRILSVRGNLL